MKTDQYPAKLQRAIQYCMLILVLTGSVLLSLSIGSFRLFFIAMVCAVAGFIVTDTLKWFRIGGWLANTASIAILILAMKDFFDTDSSGKLVAVANLLVYLQSILMFQEKTPRLNWQILVLSLLEVVITTIFSVGFENSYLLLVYFSVAGAAMVMQCLFVDEVDIARRNRSVAKLLMPDSDIKSDAKTDGDSRARKLKSLDSNAIVVFDAPRFRYRDLWPAFVQLGAWIIAGLVITAVVFLMAPRTNKPFFQAISYKVAATGFTTKVDLNEKGKITQSNRVVFRAKFTDPGNEQPIQLSEAPYFRSMALGSLKIEDGHTTWKAPFDRIDSSYYQNLPHSARGRRVRLLTTLQPNTSPQLYSPMPASQTNNTPTNVQFCHEISALTRCRYDGKVSAIPFKYELATTIGPRNRPLKGWPYLSRSFRSSAPTMAAEPLRQRWLTLMDRQRYPSLVEAADRIASQVAADGGSRQQLIDQMNQWFSSNGFKYTLDYRNVPRDETLDTVEDFFRNHRSGHCEMYASALTLMLRSQGVPARLVVGYLANDYNDLTKSYVVKEKHAHAWVEAYLAPEDCSAEMARTGMAGPGGAWLIVDPNPLEVLSSGPQNTNDPIELARTVWQDIVLGMDGQTQNTSMEDASMLYRLISAVKLKGESTVMTLRQLPQDPRVILAVAGVFAGLILLKLIGAMGKTNSKTRSGKKIGLLRRMVASAAGLLSSNLESWVLSTGHAEGAEFYKKLERLLEKHGLERTATQTHRQFAVVASASFAQAPSHDRIDRLIHGFTERFNAIRFGNETLSPEEEEQIRRDLVQLATDMAEKETR